MPVAGEQPVFELLGVAKQLRILDAVLPNAVDQLVDFGEFAVEITAVLLLLPLLGLLPDELVCHQKAVLVWLAPVLLLGERGMAKVEMIDCGKRYLLHLGLCREIHMGAGLSDVHCRSLGTPFYNRQLLLSHVFAQLQQLLQVGSKPQILLVGVDCSLKVRVQCNGIPR
ncbi:MAG: hypothetical protein JST59_00735 [Actinobacteria bacterium]|nr:hypothetical protein [Actinomycetota bacterium]